MFLASEAVIVNIIVNGNRIAVPGISTSDEYSAPRITKNGATVQSQFVDVLTYHDVPAEQSRSGVARKYWKIQRQAAYFMEPRMVAVPELDDLTTEELLAKVNESVRAIQFETTGVARPAGAIRPKANFTQTTAPISNQSVAANTALAEAVEDKDLANAVAAALVPATA